MGMQAAWRTLAGLALAFASLAAQGAEWRVVGTQFARVFEPDASGETAMGLAADVLRAVAARTGDTVHFKLYPWARAQAMVEHGEADVLVGPYKSPERLLRFAFAERPFYQDDMVFYTRMGGSPSWSGSYATIRGLRIVAVNGWIYGSAFDTARAEWGINNVPSVENGLMMLMHNRIDLLAANRRNTEAAIDTLQIRGAVQPLLPIIDVQQGYFAFPRQSSHDGLRQRFNQAFNQLVDSGELARLARKHGVTVPGP